MSSAHANPLRQRRPDRSQRVLAQRMYFCDERGQVLETFGLQVMLSRAVLWLNRGLAIPLEHVEGMQLLRRRGLVPRHYLEVTYRNPITGWVERFYLCKFDALGLGFYRREPLVKLQAEIERLRAARAGSGPEAEQAPLDLAPARCEVCGARPAHYVAYVLQVAAVIFAYRSGGRRRVHYRRHNLTHGLLCYVSTLLLGWPVINPAILVAYPVAVYSAGLSLRPALGRAAYVLGVLPAIAFLGFVAWLFVR